MLSLIFAAAGSLHFFLEARKRNVSSIKWVLIAFVAFMGPQALALLIVTPVTVVFFEVPPENSLGLQFALGVTGLVIGFWVFVVARKRLLSLGVRGKNLARAENIDHQRQMLDVTWEKCESHGVDDKTELILKFVYLAPDKKSAHSLNHALEDCDSVVGFKGHFRREWYVDGKSHRTNVSKEVLTQWLEFMVALGWEHGCEFERFDTSMPGET